MSFHRLVCEWIEISIAYCNLYVNVRTLFGYHMWIYYLCLWEWLCECKCPKRCFLMLRWFWLHQYMIYIGYEHITITIIWNYISTVGVGCCERHRFIWKIRYNTHTRYIIMFACIYEPFHRRLKPKENIYVDLYITLHQSPSMNLKKKKKRRIEKSQVEKRGCLKNASEKEMAKYRKAACYFELYLYFYYFALLCVM